ncbi:MAG: HPF/RaiA family ribosome-associated protein [Planctomycetota bacterium]|nr:MAG: HPF/RaiA family ribosome-associated protein [Planctomycetota bacterium]
MRIGEICHLSPLGFGRIVFLDAPFGAHGFFSTAQMEVDMELRVQTRHVNLDSTTRDLLDRRMNFALGQFNGWIHSVDVVLEDVNGPKGGVDKHCRVLVSLRGGKVIKIEDLDADLVTVINRTADRVSQAVGRELDRRKHRKGGMPAAGPVE